MNGTIVFANHDHDPAYNVIDFENGQQYAVEIISTSGTSISDANWTTGYAGHALFSLTKEEFMLNENQVPALDALITELCFQIPQDRLLEAFYITPNGSRLAMNLQPKYKTLGGEPIFAATAKTAKAASGKKSPALKIGLISVVAAVVFCVASVAIISSFSGADTENAQIKNEETQGEAKIEKESEPSQTPVAKSNGKSSQMTGSINGGGNDGSKGSSSYDKRASGVGVYVRYEKFGDELMPNMVNGSVFVSITKCDEQWVYLSDADDVVEYIEAAEEAGCTDVICLVPSEPGVIQGAGYPIGEVLEGYENGTWTFENAEEDMND